MSTPNLHKNALPEERGIAEYLLARFEQVRQTPRTELQENTLGQLVGTLEDLADFDAQRRYKAAVPFVHVPIELAEQWYGYERLLDRQEKWFLDLFAANELAAIRKFGLLFRTIDTGGDLPDVEEIFEQKDWVAVSAAAQTLLSVLSQREQG